MDYLKCENIEIKYDYKPLLSHVSLNLSSGYKMALTGANGCGKTSLLKVLAGLTRPNCGSVHCFEEEIWPKRLTSKEHFCLFLSSDPALLLDHNILWNLEYYCRSFGIKKTITEYEESLKNVGLLEKKNSPARLLSTGQKRRLTFAALKLIKPLIILADEPTNGLDEEGYCLSLLIFQELVVKNKSALLIATHDKNLISWCGNFLNLENYSPKKVQSQNKIKDLFL